MDALGVKEPGAEIAIIIPTFNEARNVPVLVEKLTSLLPGRRWEVIFVDDNSPDGTPEVVKQISRAFRPVRLLYRPVRRGLSSAVVEGIFATTAEYIVVMDGDLQHDEAIIPRMLEILERSAAVVVIGSRHAEGGGNEGMTQARRRISDLSNLLARRALGRSLGDLMSGFFAFRRDDIAPIAAKLNAGGFKILLEILFHLGPQDRVVEVPYTFRDRAHGESKLGFDAAFSFAVMIADRLVGRALSRRFVKFCLVGLLGVAVHFALLWTFLNPFKFDFAIAQLLATTAAATSNYYVNNRWTYGEVSLRGGKWFTGLMIFLLISSVGILANVGVASAVYDRAASWQISAIAGIAVGVFWNYMMTKISVWKV